jgi:hypothetical protein
LRNSWIIGGLVVAVCVFSRSVVADELFRYNYIEVGYGKVADDAKGFSPKIDGSDYGIMGSYAIHELVAIGIQYSKSKASFNGSYSGVPASTTLSGNDLIIGATLHKMISDNTELGFDLERDHTSIDASTIIVAGTPSAVPSSTDNTNVFAIRVRTAIIPVFRLLASIGRSTGGNFGASTDYNIGVEYELGKDFSLGAGYRVNNSSTDNVRGLAISGRYYY